ncbi:MAG TPA: histidine kinase N-terminal domain-containing protein [Actinomycetales bacterium]|nr:histidine kinase N-terminal domain-containing protein [Actinomycetales bacterium]
MSDMVHRSTDLAETDVEWLHQLVGDWQLLSDLSFADLVLWVRTATGWLAVAHVRPTTGTTVFFDDVVGTEVPRGRRVQLDRAWDERRICRERDPEWRDDVPVREETIPVGHEGRVVAVLSRHTNLATMRTPSRLELTYTATADALASMIAAGAFPDRAAGTGSRRGAPRVGDGLLQLDREGVVTYASPNAVSAFHRLGHDLPLVGSDLSEVATSLVRERAPVDEGLPLVLTGKAPWRAELEGTGTSLSLRAIPLLDVSDATSWHRVGAVLLMRDVSELRRRERDLLSKDATIREIHHRVKNNLQTVAALLRLQSRRLGDSPARHALDEAGRRVAAIALVHETLSAGFDETVDFDDVAARGLSGIVEVARRERSVRTRREGSFGRLRAEDATALSLVLTELVQNAVEHGLRDRDGEVLVLARRSREGSDDDRLVVEVRDDGCGMPGDVGKTDGRPDRGLGMQIVRALADELGGQIEWSAADGGGTAVRLECRPRRVRS